MHEISWRLSSSGNGRQVAAAGAQAGLDVHHRDAQVEGRERRGHRRAGVAVDEHGRREAPAERRPRASAFAGCDRRTTRWQKSSKRRITDATRSFSCARVPPTHSVDVGLDPGELEDLARPSGGAGRSRRRSARSDSLSRSARMIGTSLIASGRVPTTIGTTSRGVSWGGASRCAGAAAGGVRTIAGSAAVGTDVESWSAALSSTSRARSTREPLPASLNALPLVEYSIAELMAGDIRLGDCALPPASARGRRGRMGVSATRGQYLSPMRRGLLAW